MEMQWYKFRFNQLKTMLKTDFENGLDRKEVKKRQRKYPKNIIFPHVSTFSKKQTAPSIITVLLILVCIIYYFVSRDISAFFICAVAIINYSLIMTAYRRSQMIIAANKRYSEPETRVVRDGKIFRINQKGIVPGDIVLLREGDIVPCDGRVISAENFKVLEMNISGGNGEKDPEFLSYEPSLPTKEQKNMVFAASVVFKGEARILCCATGENTVARRRNLTSSTGKEELKLFSNINRLSNFVSLFMIFTVFVIGLISVFAYGLDGKMTDAFLSSLAFSASSMCEFFGAFALITVAYGLYFTGSKDNIFNENVIVKNVSAIDKINDMTCIVISKNSGICSDDIKIQYIYTGGYEYPFTEENMHIARRLCELAPFTVDTYKRLLTPVESALCEYAVKTDATALLDFVPLGSASLFDTALTSSNGEFSVIVRGGGAQIINRCTDFRKSSGVFSLNSEHRCDLLQVVESYEKNGYKIAAIATKPYWEDNLKKLSDAQHDLCFEGFLIMRETVVEGCSETVRKFSNAGVNVILFCDDISSRNEYLSKSLGIVDDDSKIISSYEFVNSNLNLQNIKLKNYRLYQGFDANEKRYVIDRLRKNGEKIGILGSTLSDVSLTVGSGAVSFSAGTSLSPKKQMKGADISKGHLKETGSEALKHTSDVLVLSADDNKKGGINSVLDALKISKQVYDNAGRIMMYLFTSFLLRLILTLISVFTTLLYLSPSQILFSGLAVDFCGIFTLASAKSHEDDIPSQTEYDMLMKQPSGAFLYSLVWIVFVCLSTLIVRFVVGLSDIPLIADGSAYLSYILSQTVLILIFYAKGKKKALKGIGKFIWLFILLVVELFLLSVPVLFPKLAEFTALGTISEKHLLLIFAPAVLLALLNFTKPVIELFKVYRTEK
ncbi:MAG: cation-transporting P-type ATPase [Clostridia bacterium]|nr:cation-transporting P-type ATPase [Clostridia bacterium]